MSSGEKDPDRVAEEAAKKERSKLSARTKKGEITGNPRKKKAYIGSVEPRNDIERLFLERFDTVTPVPRHTLHRKNSIIQAAILHIHYNIPFERLPEFTGCDLEHLKTVRRADRWDEFAQELAQLARPSNLALVPQHDMNVLEEEMDRRRAKLPELRTAEERLVNHLKSVPAGTKAEGVALTNLKKIRELINETIGLSDYTKELSAARTTLMKGAAMQQLVSQGEHDAPKPAKGQVLDINTR